MKAYVAPKPWFPLSDNQIGRCLLHCKEIICSSQYHVSWQVQKVTAEELEVAIQTRDRPLIIDFYATWCGPCLLLAKELEQVNLLIIAHLS